MLKGEGNVVRYTQTRQVCHECARPAVYRWSYLLPGYRNNPRSAGYKRDDTTWCSDAEAFTCVSCRPPIKQDMSRESPGRFALLNSKGESNGFWTTCFWSGRRRSWRRGERRDRH